MRSNCLSFWLPLVQKSGVKIPKTAWIDMTKIDPNFVSGMRNIFWMKKPTLPEYQALIKFRVMLEKMANVVKFPLFLRSGVTSHKHNWTETCYITDRVKLLRNAQNIAELSFMADFKEGLPINVWAVRELIKTKPVFRAFDDMPITTEMRYFFNNKKVVCWHPYWPKEAFKNTPNIEEKLKKLYNIRNIEYDRLKVLTEQVAQYFEGYWSVDWLRGANNQWYLIDMAIGEESYHYPNCKFQIKDEKTERKNT